MSSGPIREHHATGGWRLQGDAESGWWLTKQHACLHAQLRGTTPTTCAWTVYAIDGREVREASWDDVDEAKTQAQEWMQAHS